MVAHFFYSSDCFHTASADSFTSIGPSVLVLPVAGRTPSSEMCKYKIKNTNLGMILSTHDKRINTLSQKCVDPCLVFVKKYLFVKN